MEVNEAIAKVKATKESLTTLQSTVADKVTKIETLQAEIKKELGCHEEMPAHLASKLAATLTVS